MRAGARIPPRHPALVRAADAVDGVWAANPAMR